MAVATHAGVDFTEVRYTKNPPDEATLRELIAKLEDPVENLVRKDAQFKKLGLNASHYVDDIDAVVDVLLRYPRLLQRPVLVRGDSAIIGRPLGGRKAKDRLAGFLACTGRIGPGEPAAGVGRRESPAGECRVPAGG